MIINVGIAAFIVLDVIGALAVAGLMRRKRRRDEEWPAEAGPDETTRWIRVSGGYLGTTSSGPAPRILPLVAEEPTLAIMARPMYPGRKP